MRGRKNEDKFIGKQDELLNYESSKKLRPLPTPHFLNKLYSVRMVNKKE